MQNKKTLRVLSLGAGVQSSTLALMIEKGEIPMVDCAIFADTKNEKDETYEYLKYLKQQISYPLHIVSHGNLMKDTIGATKEIISGLKGAVHPPFFIRKEDSKKGLMKRQCTTIYKIKPITKKIRELLGLVRYQHIHPETKVEVLMGISYDELFRMKDNKEKWITNIFPLIENKIGRQDCLKWIKKYGYKKPVRSACIYCPYQTNKEWKIIKENPKYWKQVVNLDEQIRNGGKRDKIKLNMYLHKSAEPIKDANLEDKDANQLSLLDECDGMRGG